MEQTKEERDRLFHLQTFTNSMQGEVKITGRKGVE